MDLLQQITNKPLALEENWARQYFANLLASRDVKLVGIDGAELNADKPSIKMITGGVITESGEYLYRVDKGVAIIPIVGPLSHRFSWWYYGYRELAKKLIQAAKDPEVKIILLDMETPGGSVAGLFDLCGLIKKIDAEKPIVSLVNDMAASAGMAIASQTRRRFVTHNGDMGSIGCVMVHMSYEKMLEDMGIEATMIFSGAHKVDGNPYQKLPKSVYDTAKAETDQVRQEFAELVSSNMPLSTEELLNTEAKCYRGKDAIEIGLADEMVNAYEIIDVVNESNKSTFNVGINMTKENLTPDAQKPTTQQTEADKQAAATQQAEADKQAAATAERERIKAIVDSDEGKANPSLASHLAYDTSSSAEAAKGILAAAAKDKPKAATTTDGKGQPLSGKNSGFDKAMGQDNPNVSAETQEDTDTSAEQDDELEAMCSVYRPNMK